MLTITKVDVSDDMQSVVATMSDGSSLTLFPVAVPTPAGDPVASVTLVTQSGVSTEFVPKV